MCVDRWQKSNTSKMASEIRDPGGGGGGSVSLFPLRLFVFCDATPRLRGLSGQLPSRPSRGGKELFENSHDCRISLKNIFNHRPEAGVVTSSLRRGEVK